MGPRRRRRPALLAGGALAGGALALLLAASLGSASATEGPRPVPEDVVTWFVQDAPAAILDSLDGAVVVDDTVEPYRTVTVGQPRGLSMWSAPFRRGEQTDVSPTEPYEEWIAPFAGDGVPAGTVTAWRPDGEVELAFFDDQTSLATALGELDAAAQLVHEPVLGAYFALRDGQVRTLVPGWYEGPSTVVPLGQFQAALADSVRALEQPVADDGAGETGPRWWLPVGATLAGLAVLALVAVALTRAWRRTAVP